MSEQPTILAVDGNSLVHRSFHALAGTGLRNDAGAPIWAVRGLLSQLVMAVDRLQPQAVIVGFDDGETSIRRASWPQYKAQRTDKLDTLVSQLSLAAAVLTELGIRVVTPTGLEADDVLASTSRSAAALGARTVIMTSDRDSFALIADHTSVLRIINGGVDASPVLTPERLYLLTGVHPAQYRDFAALRGDPSDNLPGVRGIGPKTAAKLLSALGTARAAFDDLDDLASGGTAVIEAVGRAAAARLAEPESRAAWELNCQVMRFHDDLELEVDDLIATGSLPLNSDTVRRIYREHQLPSTLPVALRALAHVDLPDAPVTVASQADLTGWSSSAQWRSQRYGRLPVRPAPEPKAEQLSLFG